MKSERRTIFDYLDGIYRRFGYYRNLTLPVALDGVDGARHLAGRLSQLRRSQPEEIDGRAVTSFVDFADESGPLGPIVSSTDRAARNLLVFELGPDTVVRLRPSGTEPKCKVYIEMRSTPSDAGDRDLDQIRSEVNAAAERLGRAACDALLGPAAGT